MQREFYSSDAENQLLGALMLKPELCEEIGARLPAGDFYHIDQRELYSMILALHSKGIRPDAVSLGDYKTTLPSGEVTIYLAGMLQANVVSAANARHYAKIIMERALARRAHTKLEEMMHELRQPGDLAAMVAAWQNSLLELSAADSSPDVHTYADLVSGVVEDIDQRFTTKESPGIEFGLTDLDKILCKLRPGNLVVVAGKPGTGKTVLATGLADKVATKDGKGALVFSLEMSKEELVNRTLASLGGIEKGRLDSGQLLDEDWPRLTSAVNVMTAADVRICDRPALTFNRLCNIARFQYRAKPFSVIVVDYLTLIRSDDKNRHASRSAEIGSFTRGLKALAKELGVAVVVLAQLNRSMDSRADAKPRLSDLRDSGEIEQDADVVILGYRDDKSNEGRAGLTEWDVAKCRHAKPGVCTLQFQGEYQRFVNAAQSDAYSHERNTKSKRSGKSLLDDFSPDM